MGICNDNNTNTNLIIDAENSLNVALINEILLIIKNNSLFEDVISKILARTGELLELSHIKLFLSNPSGNQITDHTYDNGAKTITRSNFLTSQISEQYKSILDALDINKIMIQDANNRPFNDDAFNVENDDNSHIVYNICSYKGKDENPFPCYLLLSKNQADFVWEKQTVSLVSKLGQIIEFLYKNYLIQAEMTTTLEAFQSVLNNIDSYVSVSTLDSDTIIFANKKFYTNFGNDVINKDLWEVVGADKQEYYKNYSKLSDAQKSDKHYVYEIYSKTTKQWLSISHLNLSWTDGNTVMLSTINDITQRINYEKLIEFQVLNDHLTGLPNRRSLELDFVRINDDAIQNNSYGYLLFLDLDNFKNVNDDLGHHYGDTLLQNIASFLFEQERTGCSTYRFGGDEFVILIPHACNMNVNSITETLLKRFRLKWNISETSYFCTMSVGIARFPYDGTSLTDILKKADMALYSAKSKGKNQALYYKNKIGTDSIRNIEYERYMRESISNSFFGFSVYYQPITDTKTNGIIGAEALLRWSYDNSNFIPPSQFIPLAEKLGLMIELGDFVLKKACIQCKRMILLGFEDFKMNINISVSQLFETDFIKNAYKIITDFGVPFKNIVFEITESLAISDFNYAYKILKAVSSLGISIALDDFGTGYSSLNNIKKLPLKKIKIDKSFIDDMLIDSSTEIFVEFIISLAHQLDMQVCAEGVEEESQYRRLSKMNVDLIQGYYIGKPMPASDFEKIFMNI